MRCLPHQFQCGSRECLDAALVCNGFINCADGSDEGGSCQTACTEDEKSRCSQSCYSTPQGPVSAANVECGAVVLGVLSLPGCSLSNVAVRLASG